MKYQTCDCDPLDFCEHKKERDMGRNFNEVFQSFSPERQEKIMKAAEEKYKTRCNCDASCGENRYHDVGDSGCRFRTEEEYDIYWGNRRNPEMETKSSPTKVFYDETTGDLRKPYVESMTRPWGKWHVLDVDKGYKVKRLEILPDQAISLQYHQHRSEHWTIVQGEGKVIVDGRIFPVRAGESFHVPRYAIHKITNTHLNEILIAIEVQMGDICSEDDIVRC